MRTLKQQKNNHLRYCKYFSGYINLLSKLKLGDTIFFK